MPAGPNGFISGAIMRQVMSRRRALEWLMVVLVASGVFCLGVMRPTYNWDMIGYVASAYQRDGLVGDQLSKATYDTIQREVGSRKFRTLTTGPYRATAFADPASLEQNLPFYSIRIVYVELMRWLRIGGISYSTASYTITAFFAAASIMLLGMFCRRLDCSLFWIPVVAGFAGHAALAGRSNPDMMAGFMALSAIYLFMRANDMAYLVAAILPFFRTDLVICSSLIAMAGYMIDRRKYLAVAGAVVALGSYLLINAMTENYGYSALFNFTFIGIDAYPRDMIISDDIGAYAAAYLKFLPKIIAHWHIVLYAALCYYVVVGAYAELPFRIRAIGIICGAYTFIHLALYPIYQDRSFAFSVALLFLVLLVCRRQQIQRRVTTE